MLFADEPTGNLDSRSSAEVLGLLRDAVDTMGQTVVMVTHDPPRPRHADDVLFLADGRIVDEMERPTAERVLDRMSSLRQRSSREHRPLERSTVMFKVSAKGMWAHKRRLFGTVFAVVLGVAFLAGTLVLGDTMRAGFDDAFTEANAASTASCAATTKVGTEETETRGLIDASLVDTVAQVDGVATAVADRRTRRARSSAPTATRSAATVRRREAGNWITDAGDQPVARRRRPRADGPGEMVINETAADDGKLQRRRHHDRAHARAGRGEDRRHRPARRRRQHRRRDLRRLHARRGATPLHARRRRRSTSVIVAAEPGVSQEQLVAQRAQPRCPTASRRSPGTTLTARGQARRSTRASSTSSRRSCSCSPASRCSSARSASTTRSRS